MNAKKLLLHLKQLPRRLIGRLAFRRFSLKHGARLRLKRSTLYGLSLLMAFSTYFALTLPRNARTYALDESAIALLSPIADGIAERYKFDADEQYFAYNDSIIREDASEPIEVYITQLGAGQGDIDTDLIFGARLSENSQDGLLLYNNNMKMSIRMIPEFATDRGGVHEDGYFIYPIAGSDSQLVYTPALNGFKEDIIVPELPADPSEVVYDYRLELGEFLEARLEDDGAIGIYSADLSYFGETSFGNDADLDELIELRKDSEKTNLVFYIPTPEIRQSGDAPLDHNASIHFELNGDVLSVVSRDLGELEYPIAIDPTLVTTTDADFAEGSNLGFIDYPSGAIARDALTGGTLTSATNDDSLGAARAEGGLVFYNDYAYYVGGTSNGSNYQTTVYRSAVGVSGDLGSWSALTGDDLLDTGTRGHALVEYNGFMYTLGGEVSGNTAVTTVNYVDFQSAGALGDWTTTTALPAGRDEIAAVAYNGYMYAVGGTVGATEHDDVYSAPINADGTLGSWTTLTVLPANRTGHDVFVSNGALYVVGGTDGTVRDTVYYAYLADDGTLEGGWQTDAEALLDATVGTSAVTYNGYGYAIGGGNTSTVAQTWNQYTPLNADGTISLWANTDVLNTARREHSSAAYKGYVYSAGGINGSGTYQSSVERFDIDTAGEVSTVRTTTDFAYTVNQFASTIYNGYVYTSGGFSSDKDGANSAPLNEDGTIGTWTTEATLAAGHGLHCMTALNGYVYVIGGWDPSLSNTVEDYFTDEVEFNNIESDGTLGSSWTSATKLPEFDSGDVFSDAYRGINCFAHNGRIYAIGGRTRYDHDPTGNVDNTNIYYATPDADGDITSWTTNTATLPTSSPNLQGQNTETFVYNDRIYRQEVNGQQIWYNDIGSDGEIDGTWTQTSANLSREREQAGVALWNGYVYFVAGASNVGLDSTYSDEIEFGKIDEDGDISAFTVSNSLATTGGAGVGIRGVEAIANRGQLIMIGGYNGFNGLDDTQIATLGHGGSGISGTFTGGTDIGTAIGEHCSVTVNGYLYRIGGDTGSGTEVDTVEYSAIAADGSNGAWTSTSVLPEVRAGHACVTYNGRIYVTGGTNATATRQTTVYWAEPASNGAITSWNTTSSFTTAREDHAAVAWNGYLYIMGGDTASGTTETVYYATINSNGTLGTFSSTTSMDTQRENFAALGFGGYLYAIGGNDDGTRLDTIEYAEPNTGTGAIPGSGDGDWAATFEMIDPTEGMQAFAVNGFIHVVGGLYTDDAGSDQIDNRVKAAHISTNGIIEAWDIGENLSIGRWDHGAAEFNGRLYVVGGFTNTGGTTDITDVEYAGLKSIARKGVYSKVIDLGDRFRITSLTFTGTILSGGQANFTFRAACTDGVFSNVSSYEDVQSAEEAILGVNGRYVLMIVEIDDSRAIGFHDASQSDITQIDLEYAYGWTEPDVRLRGGNFFSGGEEQPYDTIQELAGGVVPCD